MNSLDAEPHVLVIDDDPAIVRVYTELLQEEGCRITSWPFPDQNVAAIRAIDPDVILVDLFFGESNAGWHFVEFLREQPDTVNLPVIVASASSRIRQPERDQLAEWDCRVIVKPFDIEEIIEAVEDALARIPVDS